MLSVEYKVTLMIFMVVLYMKKRNKPNKTKGFMVLQTRKVEADI